LSKAKGFLCADYTEDGLHPNGAGYVAIRPVLEQALES
jgi:lysophospholipase L1-like esterase